MNDNGSVLELANTGAIHVTSVKIGQGHAKVGWAPVGLRYLLFNVPPARNGQRLVATTPASSLVSGVEMGGVAASGVRGEVREARTPGSV